MFLPVEMLHESRGSLVADARLLFAEDYVAYFHFHLEGLMIIRLCLAASLKESSSKSGPSTIAASSYVNSGGIDTPDPIEAFLLLLT